MKSRIFSVSRKEFVEIRRDPRSLGMVLAFPVMMLMIYSYAVNFDVKSIKTVVYDPDNSKQSRELITEVKSSGYFAISYIDRYDDVEKQLDSGKARLALCIPADFSRKLSSGKTAPLQAIFDGSDANTATISIGYIQQIVQRYSANIRLSALKKHGINVERAFPPIDAQLRVWYNPELKSVNFIIPGLIATIMMIVGAMSTSLSIVSERERGTFEKLIVTPIRPRELVIGKMLPYITFIFFDMVLCILVGRFWFKVPIKGSIPLLFCLSVLFLFSAIGLGLLISTIAKTQRVAMLLSMIVSLLPTFLLSGFVFAIDDMPKALQIITYLVPARYFLAILRGIYMRGVGLRILWIDVVWLIVFALAMLFISAVRFGKKLES
jgi:ABC-2 type transport system permease protein